MSPTSPMQQIGAKLVEKGVSIVPIAPREKYPARWDGAWHPLKEWDKYGKRLPSDSDLDAWESWPGCGVGVLPGQLSGIVVVDIDTDDPAMIAAIESITPPSIVRKRGSIGYSGFYRYSGEQTRRFNVVLDGQTSRVVDLLSGGTQCVIPPSQHPSGDFYEWLTPFTLDDTDLAELPTLPDNYADLLGEVLAPWSGDTNAAPGGGDLGEEVVEYDISESEFRELASALAKIPHRDYEHFIKVGMCLREIGFQGLRLWDAWAKDDPKYYEPDNPENYISKKFYGFKCVAGGLTHGTIFKMAKEEGWEPTPLPDYAAELEAGMAAKRRVKKTGLYATRLADLGEFTAPDWVIRKHLTADSLGMLYGPSGAGKSFAALDMGLSVASGRQWQGHDVKKGLVLYVCGEGERGINTRCKAWCKHHNVDPQAVEFHITSQPVPLLDVVRVHELLTVIDDMPAIPVLIIVDTLNRNFGGGDENSTKDMTGFVDGLARLQSMTRAAIFVVHHTGKGEAETARGNSALRAAMDTEMSLFQKPGEILLECTKQKDAAEFPAIGFNMEIITLGHDDEGEEVTSCVMVPSAATKGAQLVQDLAGHRVNHTGNSVRGLGDSQKAALDAVREKVNKLLRANPGSEFLAIAKKDLVSDLEKAIDKREASRMVKEFLLPSGIIKDCEGFNYEINHAKLLEFSGVT